jgi:hypothetical protein
MSAAVQLGLFAEHAAPPLVPRYPERPGFKAIGASEEAARHVAGDAARLRAEVLAELHNGPGTADEIAKRMQRSPLSIRPRVSELKAMSKIAATGERRRNESGMSASVWRVITTSSSEVMS